MSTSVFERTGSVRAVAVLRILLGPITLLHLRPFLRDAAAGIGYDDHFWEPFLPWLPRLPDGLWFLLLSIGAVAAVLMSAGVLTRLSTSVTFAVVAGNLLLSQTHFRHNRTFLAILLAGVALLPAGRVLSVDALLRRSRGLTPPADSALVWPLWLLRTQVSLVYAASGVSKLVDPDWLGGLVLWDRVVRYQHVLDPWPVPGGLVELVTSRWLYYAVAPAAIAIELFLAVALWRPRTRLAAMWVAVVFHLCIEVTASVEVFSYAALAALAIWVTPTTRDRVVRIATDRPGGRALWQTLRLGDWFARFDLRPAEPGQHPVAIVIDRDGTILTGRHAVLFILTRLPAAFPWAAPFFVAFGTWQVRSGTENEAGAPFSPGGFSRRGRT